MPLRHRDVHGSTFVLLAFFGGGGWLAWTFGWKPTTMGVFISKVLLSEDRDGASRARFWTCRLGLGAASTFVFGLFLDPAGLPRGR